MSLAGTATPILVEVPPPLSGRKGWPWVRGNASDTKYADSEIEWPRITLVTPSFNQGRYLEETLRSVLLQDYPNLEYIVMDGGSTDNSVEILERYSTHLSYWQSRKDDGQSDAIASGFERATGDIYCWLNSDDILLPGALRHVGRFFNRFPATSVIYGNRLVVNEETSVIGKHLLLRKFTRYHWAQGLPLAQECCFWRRDIYRQVGGVDRSKFFIMDYDLFYKMWRQTRFRKTRAYLGAIRVHAETKNSKHQDIRLKELEKAKLDFALVEPGYFRIRIMNRLGRIQLLSEAMIDWVCHNQIPDLGR